MEFSSELILRIISLYKWFDHASQQLPDDITYMRHEEIGLHK